MTLFLNQNQTNDVVLTLREKSLLWKYSGITPYYLWQIISPTTRENILFVANNIAPTSAQTDSYDEFLITCTGSTGVNLSAGTVYINPGMFWTYNIYEQTSQYNFNTLNCVSVVETGKIQFSSATQDFQYVKMTGNTNYIAFNTY